MFPAPARPRENGRQPVIPPHLPETGTHITSATNAAATSQAHQTVTASPLQDSAPHRAVGANVTTSPHHSALITQHSALGSPRNIKASPGWLWQEKSALKVIAQRYSGDRLRAARSIYLALTEIASNQFTPNRAHTSCAYLGSLAGMKEAATRRYIHEFAALGLVEVLPGVHQANTYILLGEAAAPNDLAAASMPLADGHGNSLASDRGTHGLAGLPVGQPVSKGERRAARGIPATHSAPSAGKSRPARGSTEDPTRHDMTVMGQETVALRGFAEDPPSQAAAAARGIPADRQIVRINESITEQQTNNAGGADSAGSYFQPEINRTVRGGARLLIASGDNADYQQAVLSLTGIGVRREVAEEQARKYQPAIIRAWVRYALKASGLKSRAGFVLSRLAAGEAPPDYLATITSSWRNPSAPNPTAPQPSCGLTEVLAEQGAESPLPPSARDAAIWQAAQERLRDRVSSAAWGLWLQHVRLVAACGDLVQLASPAVGTAETFERRYAGDVCEVLGDLLGRAVEVEYLHRERLAALAGWRSSVSGFRRYCPGGWHQSSFAPGYSTPLRRDQAGIRSHGPFDDGVRAQATLHRHVSPKENEIAK